jgi:hypothetical protein
VQLHRPLAGYPVLARAGALVPLTFADDLGTGNPEALEVHVFAGADGEFTLYEDDDAAVPRSVTTRLTWDQARGEFRIAPAEGALELVPPSRRFRLVLRGLDDVVAELPDGTRVEGSAGRLEAELVVETAVGATIRLTGERRPSDNRVEGRLFDLLEAAQLEYTTKNTIWTILATEAGAARRVASVQALGLPDAVHAAITELLLADA